MKIASLQYLRGLAALLVVVAHNSSLLKDSWLSQIPGGLGVDIFFIVSGFIMTFITYHAVERPAAFLIKRFFRIWPVFFIFWLLSYLLVYPERTLQQMACTLYFCLQAYSLPAPTFGYSALGPPWTLTYEIMFYLVFTLSMGINYRYRSYICAVIFLATSVGFQLYYNGHFEFSSQASPAIIVTHWWQAWIKLLSNTIAYEFVAGMLLAELALTHKLPTLTASGRKAVQGVLLFAIISAGLVGPQVLGISGGFWLALIIAATVIMLGHRQDTHGNRALIFLGDISYSLYLVHYSLMVFVVRRVAEDASATERIGLFALSISVSIVLAAAMFEWIEKPSIKAGKTVASALFKRRAVPGAT